MTINVYKMINGEEIIGDVIKNLAEFIELEKPAQIVMQQTERGMSVGLAPYMPYVDGNLKLYRSAIASEGSPVDQMKNEYNRLFGAGIQIAPASALSGLQIVS